MPFMAFSMLALPHSKAWSADYALDTQNLCHGFARARIGSPEGTCVGVVATAENGLKRPRRILEVAPDYFLVTDMGGWAKNIGSLWSIELRSQGEALVKKLIGNLDHLHGLAMDSKGYVYLGERSRVLRFHRDQQPIKLQTVIDDLPLEGKHPLTHFIFDNQDRLIVNVGAPSDQCLTSEGKPQYPCPESEGAKPEAAIYRYTLSEGGKVVSKELLARGLRNSMGLAIHPTSEAILQAENSMDFKEEGTPREEINVIREGRHYGWPYCYEMQELNPAYKRTLFNRSIPKIDCSRFESPTLLLGAHSAPLDMIFYQGSLFPELTGKLLISYHGYRSAGHRMGFIDIAGDGKALASEQNFLFDWQALDGVRPQGSPVGLAEAHDGKIWFVEDKNKTVMFVAPSDTQIDETDLAGPTVLRLKPLNSNLRSSLAKLSRELFIPQCAGCHGFLGNENLEELHQELVKERFVSVSNPLKSEVFQRVSAEGEGMAMPPGGEVHADLIAELKSYLSNLEISTTGP